MATTTLPNLNLLSLPTTHRNYIKTIIEHLPDGSLLKIWAQGHTPAEIETPARADRTLAAATKTWHPESWRANHEFIHEHVTIRLVWVDRNGDEVKHHGTVHLYDNASESLVENATGTRLYRHNGKNDYVESDDPHFIPPPAPRQDIDAVDESTPLLEYQ